jgi:hypothetical protein
MTSEQFCYWLQGFAELTVDLPTEAQWLMIRDHLDTVFTKVTPKLGPAVNYNTAENGTCLADIKFC